jgi:hypothetical protein
MNDKQTNKQTSRLSLRNKYYPQHPVLQRLLSTFYYQFEIKFHTYIQQMKSEFFIFVYIYMFREKALR